MHLRHLLAFGSLLLGAVSCAQILGDDFQIEDGDGGGDCNSDGGCDTIDCSNCLACGCDSELGNCVNNADCQAISDCAYYCTDFSCTSGCRDGYPGGQGDWDALNECALCECGSTCSGGGS